LERVAPGNFPNFFPLIQRSEEQLVGASSEEGYCLLKSKCFAIKGVLIGLWKSRRLGQEEKKQELVYPLQITSCELCAYSCEELFGNGKTRGARKEK